MQWSVKTASEERMHGTRGLLALLHQQASPPLDLAQCGQPIGLINMHISAILCFQIDFGHLDEQQGPCRRFLARTQYFRIIFIR